MVHDQCIMKQTTGNCSDLLLQAKELEVKFLASLSAKGVLDASFRNLFSNIRHLYESIILADPALAEVQNVEHSLWQLHYRQIEEFRHHVCSVKEWVVIRDNSARSTFTKEKWIELLQFKPVLAGFRSFLTEASGFYHELILKLKANCGVAPSWESTNHFKSKAVKYNTCQQSCYRCLVNLGDYARYKEFYVGNDPFNYDFSIAADFYREAIAHWPLGGQPHNQLAVLAVYVKDDLLAVYHYFRSLAVEKPFPTTRENLTILFEKNRVKYEGLPPSPVELAVPSAVRKRSEKMNSSQIIKLTQKVKTGMELIDQFFVRFVRLNGLFFTKTSLEKFEEVYTGVLYDLQQLLALDDRNLELTLGSGNCFGMSRELHGSFGALKLVVILICTLENVMGWSKHTEAPMQKVLFQNACKALLSIVGHLMQRCAEAHHASDSSLLPAILVFLEWLTCQPDIVRGVEKDDEQFNLLSFIWKHFLRLSDGLHKEESFRKLMHDWQENSEMGVALWEDFELQGFLPLSPAHFAVINRDRSKCKNKGLTEDRLFRWCRLVASGNALANMADGSSLSAIFGQGKSKVYKSEEKSDNVVMENKISSQFIEIKENSNSSSGGQACGCDDNEEEELIVFQPAAKDHFVPSSSSATFAEPLNDRDSILQDATSLRVPSLTCTSSSISSSQGSKLHESPNPECLPNPSSLYAVDTTKSDAISSHSLDSRRFSAPAEQPYELDNIWNSKQASMAFEQLSGNRTMKPFVNPDIAFELRSYLGSRRGENSLGVIGQPKLTQTGVQEIVKGSHGVPNDITQSKAVSHTSHQEPTSSLFKGNFRNDCKGNSSPGTTAKWGEAPLPCCNQSSSLTGTKVFRPPPGFGPQPTRLPMSRNFDHMHEGKEMLRNNGLVEDSMHSNNAPVLGENLNPTPGYSFWSNVSNKIPQSGSERHSSLSASSLLPHPNVTVVQQPLQMANEKEMWSLFGSVGGYNWTPTIIS